MTGDLSGFLRQVNAVDRLHRMRLTVNPSGWAVNARQIHKEWCVGKLYNTAIAAAQYGSAGNVDLARSYTPRRRQLRFTSSAPAPAPVSQPEGAWVMH
jgi:hypothetical protein